MKKHTKVLALSLVVTMTAALLAGCGGRNSVGNATAGSQTDTATGGDAPIVIKIAHTDSGSRSTNIAALEFKEYMESTTDGRVSVEVYPDGQLGDDDDLLKAVQLNTVQIYIGGETTVSSLVGAQVGITNLPYLYDSYEDWCAGSFERGGLALYNSLLGDSGFTCLDFEYDGFRNIITTNKPVRTLADLSGQKIRVANTDLYLATYKALGGNATPMAFGEVYTGLTQGTIDGVDHCLGVMVDQKYYEPCQYLTRTNHINIPLVVISSTAFVESLPADVREVFQTGIAQMAATQRTLEYEKEQSCIQTMTENGIEVIALSDAQLQEFRAATAPIYDQWRDVLGSDIMDQVLEIAGK